MSLRKSLNPARTTTKKYTDRDLLLLMHGDLQKILVGIGALVAIHAAQPVLGSTPFETASEILLVGAATFTLIMLVLSHREGWIVGTKLRFAVMLGYLLVALVGFGILNLIAPDVDSSAAAPFLTIGFSIAMMWWAISIPVRPPPGLEPGVEE